MQSYDYYESHSHFYDTGENSFGIDVFFLRQQALAHHEPGGYADTTRADKDTRRQ